MQLLALFLGGQRRQRNVVRRVAADLHAVPLQVKEVVPRHIAGETDIIRHHIEHCLHAALFEHRQNDTVVVLVAIVKGEDDGFFGQLLLALACACIVLRRNRRIPLRSEIVQLRCKVLG